MSEEVVPDPCTHHWVIGQIKGGVAPSRCKLCGKEKEEQADLRDDALRAFRLKGTHYQGRDVGNRRRW